MNEEGYTGDDEQGGLGCWWMIAIAIIVVLALIVGFLVLT
jgi:hypothetical protein